MLALIHCLKKPLVVHNGLVDLMFLYHSFYTVLPTSLTVFLADLTELLPGGVYDTKVVAEYQLGETASYLEYLFRKRWGSLWKCALEKHSAWFSSACVLPCMLYRSIILTW